MNKKLTLIASSLLAAFSPSVFASSDVSQFDEVVVTGTRSEESIKNVPASIAKVTAEEIENNLAVDVKQALKYEPGVSVNGRGRFGMEDITIRGMSGSRVKVIVDGIEQMASYNPGAEAMRMNSNNYEVDTLTAIEVNKGPSSTLYGSDALGGTVLLRTKTPEDMLLDGDDTHVGVTSGYRQCKW
ncbi:TonB-dependent receptor plug domain-containing protein [Photobacterium leiognathi]|uniref:TonB-dependent receptor plug domain-containing protein n=1 Tax=Photobacterium leiognathi TaxID=553611 RepID=UPI00273A19DD|nr:TonB-dependent receptor plug domain-containing protein [Photobacterium leiognathi]